MKGAMLTAVAALILLPAAARGDVIQPEFAVCRDLNEGDACTVTEGAVTPLDGTCQKDEECRLNYSGECDGGGPCGTICSEALKCKASEDKPVDDDSGSCAVPAGSLPLGSGVFFLAGLLLILRLRRS